LEHFALKKESFLLAVSGFDFLSYPSNKSANVGIYFILFIYIGFGYLVMRRRVSICGWGGGKRAFVWVCRDSSSRLPDINGCSRTPSGHLLPLDWM
jgi:hypothetical protein